jgi:NAD(P)-dependent dehydrogenase (short-subunit alcohol dehydrogenase family)
MFYFLASSDANCFSQGYAFCSKKAVPHMRKRGQGAIINIASISSFVAQEAFVPYNTSKGAIMQMTRCMAFDLGVDNIRVNAVCPGAIDTPATELHAQKLGITKEELKKDFYKQQFLKRMGEPRDVSNSVIFLASDEAKHITGTHLMVDAGYTAM